MKAKIKRINKISEFTNSFGTTFYYQLEMENNDKIEIGKKKKLEIGWELEYEIVERGAQEYQKSKTPPKDVVPPPAQTQTPSTFQKANVQDDILYQVCLKGAMDFYASQHGAGLNDEHLFLPKNICSMALAIAQQSKKDIETLKNS